MFAPITGELLSQMILGIEVEDYAKELHINRFKENKVTDFERSVV